MWRKTLDDRTPSEEPRGQDSSIEQILYHGGVRRYHTRPMIGEQTVATHCWGVATIILRLCPKPSVELIKAALWHDLAEGFVGDVPYTLREYDESTKTRIDALETHLLKEEFKIEFNLTLEERNWLKCADMLELVLFSKFQMDLGNKFAGEVMINGLIYLEKMKKPKEMEDELSRFKQQLITEIPELSEPDASGRDALSK